MSGFYFIFNIGLLLGRTSEVGEGQSQEKFFWLDGRTEITWLDGWTADSGRMEVFTSL